ncbi:MAG: L-threonylcarbamoyladenylate synthase, partial [candidate division KSB1 bacterium]|nr:L-threonylcarbamoyladenylate synthase [candidate division KSB1 bacterium]
SRYIDKAVKVLNDGGLIIYPTDTVYGLGCDLLNRRSVERIYQIKGVSKKARLSFICPDLKDIAKYAHVSNPAYKIMRRLLPGPYTFILEATRAVPKILTEKRSTVGIRVPDHAVCRDLVRAFGRPIISTSAALAEGKYLTDPDEIAEVFAHLVDLFLDCDVGGAEPSTVIDLTQDEPIVVRKGKGYRDDLFL